MSGGSYSYLCFKDSSDIGQNMGDLEAMARRLDEMGHHVIAADSREVRAMLDVVQARLTRMHDVWHAVEWRDSGDYGADQAEEACALYMASRFPGVQPQSPWRRKRADS